MAKYISSPWGEIRGKLGDVIGTRARGGICFIRMYLGLNTRGTEKALLSAGDDTTKRKEFKFRQFNQTHAVFPLLSTLAHKHCTGIITKVWNPFVRGTPLTGAALFMKKNCSRFHESIPDKNQFYSRTNIPDLTKINLTEGGLEPADITSTNLSRENSEITVNWNTECYLNGKPDDDVYLVGMYWQIPESTNWYPNLKPWETLKAWFSVPFVSKGYAYSVKVEGVPSPVKRKDGTAKLSLRDNIGTDARTLDIETGQLVVFLFLYNNTSKYSKSVAVRVKN